MDIPEWTCKTCRYSGPVFEYVGEERVECRRNHPSSDGFPMLPPNSWCWDGTLAYNQRKNAESAPREEQTD